MELTRIDVDGDVLDIEPINSKIEELETDVQDLQDQITAVTDGGYSKVTVGGEYQEVFDADTKANVEDLQTVEENATAYTDTAIANLVGTAPETLDTLQEVATAIQENETVVEALNSAIGNKVDKVEGKGLSTNDYTTAEKEKLAGVEEGANNYVLPNEVVQDASYVHTDNNYTTEEKEKLAGLENYDDTALSNRVTTVENNKADKTELFSGSFNDLSDVPDFVTTNTEQTIDANKTFTGQVITPSVKNDDSKAKLFMGNNNEFNFDALGNVLYIGYSNPFNSESPISQYHFGKHTGGGESKQGEIYAGKVFVNDGAEEVTTKNYVDSAVSGLTSELTSNYVTTNTDQTLTALKNTSVTQSTSTRSVSFSENNTVSASEEYGEVSHIRQYTHSTTSTSTEATKKESPIGLELTSTASATNQTSTFNFIYSGFNVESNYADSSATLKCNSGIVKATAGNGAHSVSVLDSGIYIDDVKLVDFVVEVVTASSGGDGVSSWANAVYRRWNSGIVEQWFDSTGGTSASNAITLPFPMPSANYTGSKFYTGSSANSGSIGVHHIQMWNRSTTGFTTRGVGSTDYTIYLKGM